MTNKGNIKAFMCSTAEKQPLDLCFQDNSHTSKLVLARENDKSYAQAN